MQSAACVDLPATRLQAECVRYVCLALAAGVLILALAPYWAPLLKVGPPPPPPPGEQVSIGGAHLNVFIEGKGPDVILIHGRPGTAYDWLPLPEQLVAAGYRVTRYDRIGYGHSSRRPVGGAYDFEVNAEELLMLLNALSIERAILVGWSYGGGVAQVAARLAPERVAGLLLVASVGVRWDHEEGETDWGERILQITEPVQRWGLEAGFAAGPGLRRTGEIFFSGPAPPWWQHHMHATLVLPGAVHTWVEEGRQMRRDQLQPEHITVRTTILRGSADSTGGFEVAEDLQRRIPNAKLVRVEAGSHMLPNTHAELVVEEVAALQRQLQVR